MLEGLAFQYYETPLYRYANQSKHLGTLAKMGLDSDAIEEVGALFKDQTLGDDPDELLDGPFEDKIFLRRQTRFSDGTIRIFYSALEPETAAAEVFHWYAGALLGEKTGRRPVFYRRVRCQFRGVAVDLRPKVPEWPFLVADAGYAECNKIGAEAYSSQLDALLSQSARRPVGTTVPVFRRSALSGSTIEGDRVFLFDPATGAASVKDAH